MEEASGYGAVSPPWWNEAWIVACGPSARSFDFDRLRGKTVLAVNEAALFLTSFSSRLATAVFSIDHRWIGRRRLFLEEFAGEKYLAVPLETWPECAGITGAMYLRRLHERGLSEDPGIVCTGGNSGYAAVNLCVLKRARVIHLVGYDMDPVDSEKYGQWASRFHSMLPQLQVRGVRVINHNPRSHIDAFKKEI
jgi:hypothetical protein